ATVYKRFSARSLTQLSQKCTAYSPPPDLTSPNLGKICQPPCEVGFIVFGVKKAKPITSPTSPPRWLNCPPRR
ncbi:PTS system, glucose-specific IIBC component, partial [Vibrio parahaemolyticus V-223/04]